MDIFFASLDPVMFATAVMIAVIAGVIKGMVGFGMPMVMISGLSSFIAPELALAGLIMPTLATNGIQALRQGRRAAWHSIQNFRVFLLAGLVTLLISAQFVRWLPADVMLLIIGGPVAIFTTSQLMGLRLHMTNRSRRVEVGVGAFAGAIGGLSGVWGAPTVLYLTALNTEKTEQMRVQGVIYGLGAAALFVAHIGSGVLRWDTLPFSVAMVPSALVGMWLGGKVQDRISQDTFRKATLIILTIAALNLVRRALMG